MPTYDDDPYLAPVWNDLRSVEQRLGGLQQYVQGQQQARQAESQQRWLNHWQGQLGALQQQHPEMDAESVVRFAAAEGLRDMTQAYRLMHFEDTMHAAEARGIERARAQGSPPRIVPHAQAAAPTSPASSMGEALRAASQDPDVLESLTTARWEDLPARPKMPPPSFGRGAF